MTRLLTNHDRRRRGSLLVLAVVALVIIAVLGLAVLQQNKMDRFAVEKHERNYIQLAINGTIAEIRKQLQEDYFHNRDSVYGLYDYPWTTTDGPGWVVTDGNGNTVTVNGTPKQDSSSTSPRYDDTYLASTFPIVTANDTVTWPHLSNLTGIWLDLPEIGSGNGWYDDRHIDGGAGTNNSDTLISTDDTTPTGLGGRRASGYEIRGADADGDGVLDSEWQWCPVGARDFGGRRYVMAMRLIDLSSLINLNTATVDLLDDGTTPPLDQQYLGAGYTPVDVDLSRLIARTYPPNTSNSLYGTYGQRYNEIGAVLDRRFLYGTTNQLFTSSFILKPRPMTPGERLSAWRNQASLYGNTDNTQYRIDNEYELRYGGGLNNDKNNTIIEGVGTPDSSGDPTGLMRVTRNDEIDQNGNTNPDGRFDNPPTTEGSWSSALAFAPATYQNLYYWFQGGDPVATRQIAARRFPAIRQFLTTRSGHSVYLPTYGNTSGAGRLQCDLNYIAEAVTATYPTAYDFLVNKIDNAFEHRPGPTYYLGLSSSTTPSLSAVIDQYALNILDYGDEDYRPTTNGTYYGIEKLPFLREVYLQCQYEDSQSNLPTSTDYDQWKVKADSEAMAIEMGNPFSYEIDPAKLVDGTTNLWQMVVTQGSGPGATSYTVTGADLAANLPRPIGPRDDTNGHNGDLLIIYSNPVDKDTLEGGATSDLLDSSNLDAQVDATSTTASNDALAFESGAGSSTSDALKFTPVPSGTITGQDITVELQVRAVNPDGSDAGWVTYDRMRIDTTSVPVEIYPHTAMTTPPAPQSDTPFKQYARFRDSEHIRYVIQDGMGENASPDPADAPLPTFDSAIDQFTVASDQKATLSTSTTVPAAWGDDAGFQLPHADGPYLSVAELGWMSMVGFTSTETIPERFYDMTSTPLYMFLNVDPNTTYVPAGGPLAGNSGLPFVAMLFDQFTVLSPRYNDRDEANNGDDAGHGVGDNDPLTPVSPYPRDDAREQFIPGTININTASLEVLTLAAPLLDVRGGTNAINDTQALMTAICAYRDDPIYTATNHEMRDAYGSDAYDGIRDNIPVNRGTSGYWIPGIASLGELLYINPTYRSTSGFSDQYNDMLCYGYDGSPQNGSTVDLYPDPISLANANHIAERFDATDSQEEAMARFQTLAQAFSVRSDIFAAYVMIRGYEANNFSAGPVEEARFLVILDRGAMANNPSSSTDPLEAPRVIGYLRLD